MNTIKKYLLLSLSVGFCTSFQVFAMEKERFSASGEQFEIPIGKANVSSESGVSELLEEARMEKINNQQLTSRIKTLQNITEALNEQLEDFEFTPTEYTQIKELKEYIQKTISMANNMLLGLQSVNMHLINYRVETAHSVSQRFLK